MKIKLTFLFIIFLEGYLLGQKNMVQLEFIPYVLCNKYPEFTYAINSVNNNKVKIKGTGWGIDGLIKLQLKAKFQIKTGLGYYKYSFNKIRQVNSLFGKSNNRVIEYIPPGPISPSITYATKKYFYNTLALNIGIDKKLYLNKDFEMICGITFTNYYTFSQKYQINYSDGIDYKKSTNRNFGISASINAGVQKRFEKIIIGPSFILPIFNLWKKDAVFPQEENSENRKKWFKGFGAGIQITLPMK